MPEEVGNGRSELTNEEYWSDVWRSSALPAAVDPDSTPFYQDFCGFLKHSLDGWSGSLLEVGCASSRWLPYFAGLGFRVAGIDYSHLGCEQARSILEREHVEGDIYERDAFDANPDLAGRFDVVVSLGVVEHFQDTTETVRAFARYLKPRGLMISTCPNMTGVLGFTQRLLNRSVYDCHVPVTTGRLRQAHEMAGLTVANCTYIGSPDFHILNLKGAKGAKDLAYRVLMRLSKIGWALPVRLRPGQMLSSAVGCAAYQNPLPS